MMDKININDMTASELLNSLYSKKLNTKKNVLEYIELLKVLKKEDVNKDKIQENYNLVYNAIEEMGKDIKPNTMMYLKNALKSQLGKLVDEKDPKVENPFLKFFKGAYPAKERGKSFTWVMMDINNITSDQIWNSLTYINREVLTNNLRLTKEEKNETINMIKKLVSKRDIKYINKVKSLHKVLDILNIKIVDDKKGFKVKSDISFKNK